MRILGVFLVGLLFGAALAASGYAVALAAGQKAHRYDFTLAGATFDEAKKKGGIARYLDEEVGVACYTLLRPISEATKRMLPPDFKAQVTTEGLTCVKVR